MRLSFHPQVQKDINSALRYYDAESSTLGDRFFAELTAAFDAVLQNPHRGHDSDRNTKRFNLPSFPFHFNYRILPGLIRVLVVKHHKRHPRFGLQRR